MPNFVIQIADELSEHLMSWFPSLTAEKRDGSTVLSGDLPDQGALLGVLEALDMMGLEIQVAGLARDLDRERLPG